MRLCRVGLALSQFIQFLPGFLQLLVERFYFEQVVIALLGIGGGIKSIAFKQAVQVPQHYFFQDLFDLFGLGRYT